MEWLIILLVVVGPCVVLYVILTLRDRLSTGLTWRTDEDRARYGSDHPGSGPRGGGDVAP